MVQKVKDGDSDVIIATNGVDTFKVNWKKELRKRNILNKEITPGEKQEIAIKNAIIRRMGNYQRPTSMTSKDGHSVRINSNLNERRIKMMVNMYLKEMSKYNRTVDPRVTEGYGKYLDTLQEVKQKEELRQETINGAFEHVKKFANYIETELLPNLVDPIPVFEFMKRLNRKADIRNILLK